MRAVLLAALLLAACSALAAHGENAPAKDLQAQLHQKRAELTQVQQQKSQVATTIDEANRQVDALIGQVSALRLREAAVQHQLDAK